MAMTALPTPPSRGDSNTVFVTRADALLGALPLFVTEANALQTDVTTKQTTASTAATTATTQATTATTQATNASASATAAATAAAAAAWVSGNTYALNASAISQVNFQTYRKITASSVTTTDPSADSTNWTVIGVFPVALDTRTSNTALTATDVGELISCTNTYTQTFVAASTLGNKWYCYIRNGGSGDITLDPNGSETIDGLTSFIMYPGEMRLIICTGSTFFSFVLTPFYRVWTTTASNNFTKPPGYSYFGGLAWSGGGSGSKLPGGGGSPSGGGAGGGCFPFQIEASAFGATATITIGAGGTGPSSNGNGVAGGQTDVASLIYVAGGRGGLSVGGANVVGGGVVVGNGVTPSQGDGGGFTSGTNNNVWAGSCPSVTTTGPNTVYGGACGGSVDASAVAQAAGASQRGGNGGAASVASSGSNGAIPAGGGGGTNTGTKAGDGARGEVRMWGIV